MYKKKYMNKLGVKVYGYGINHINNISSGVNSIKHHNNHNFNKSIIRIIKYNKFGIGLLIKNK